MRATQFTIEAAIGTNPQRPARPGSRPARGHEPVKEIAGAFPSPSTKAKWAADAAASNAAEAKRLAAKQAIADAERLRVNNAIVDKEQRINYHPMPDNEVPVKEMDSQGYTGSRDHKSRSTYGSRDKHNTSNGPDVHLGSKNMMTSKDMQDRALDTLKKTMSKPENMAVLKRLKTKEGIFDSKPKVDWNARAKQLLASGLTEQQVYQQLVKEGCPPNQAPVYVQAAQMESIGQSLAEHGKASRALCASSRPDSDLGASNLASCKSQGLRARDGEKSHLIGHGGSKVRVTVGGKKIKGKKYGGPLPDYGTRKGQL